MRGELLLQTPVLVELFSQTLLFILNLIALVGAIQILKNWNFSSSTKAQYKLEKKSYLITLIITVTLVFSIILLPYFVYTIDSLHSIVPGAMCGAGVISANEYGYPLLISKIFIIFLAGIWLVINKKDLDERNYPFIFKKYYLFVFIFLLFLYSLYLEISYFSNISLDHTVACCSVIYGVSGTDNAIPFNLDIISLLAIFYLLALLNIYNIWQKNSFSLFLSSLAFLVTAYYAMNFFFATYIYELPTHICPFCMLQGEYYYVGYVLWGLLLLATFFGIINAVLKSTTKKEEPIFFRYSFLFLLLFVLSTSSYVIVFWIKNGVLL